MHDSELTHPIRTVVVVGAGTMGRGIAQLAAIAGFDTVLYDIHEAALTSARETIRKNLAKGVDRGKVTPETAQKAEQLLRFTTRFDDLRGDFFIEAVVEQLDLKQSIFRKLEEQNEPSAVFTSNTSSIPISAIARALQRPERLAGMHFFNPAHIMKLVEVIRGAATADDVARTVMAMARRMGKVPVEVKDSPGFVVNRVARHFYLEALRMVEEGVADVATVDRLAENFGFRMGPFRLMDLIGVDTNHSVTTSMFASFFYEPRFRPSRIQQQYVDAGWWGRKTGRGFYSYESADQ